MVYNSQDVCVTRWLSVSESALNWTQRRSWLLKAPVDCNVSGQKDLTPSVSRRLGAALANVYEWPKAMDFLEGYEAAKAAAYSGEAALSARGFAKAAMTLASEPAVWCAGLKDLF